MSRTSKFNKSYVVSNKHSLDCPVNKIHKHSARLLSLFEKSLSKFWGVTHERLIDWLNWIEFNARFEWFFPSRSECHALKNCFEKTTYRSDLLITVLEFHTVNCKIPSCKKELPMSHDFDSRFGGRTSICTYGTLPCSRKEHVHERELGEHLTNHACKQKLLSEAIRPYYLEVHTRAQSYYNKIALSIPTYLYSHLKYRSRFQDWHDRSSYGLASIF